MKRRVFLDTNVWFSALATNGICEALLRELEQYHEVLSSELIWSELASVLTRKLKFTSDELARTRELFDGVTLVPNAPTPTDDNDRRLVNTALAAQAEIFVTGDARILTWASAHAQIKILSPRDAYIEVFAPHLKTELKA
jgi:uncharacterized protein